MQQKNVRLQIEHLTTYPLIINSIKKDQTQIHGCTSTLRPENCHKSER